MSSPASINKHPIHPMLVGLPIGLWVFSLVCDLVHALGGAPAWGTVALYAIAGGLLGALLSAVPGLIDFLSIKDADMKRIATMHLSVNAAAILIFAIDLWLRLRLPENARIPLLLSICGVAAIAVGGWLGGEMVYVKGMAVAPLEKRSDTQPEKQEKPRLRRAG
jgi:uncharacterized membrane protein